MGYGINKLTIMCVIEDDKVSVDELQEKISEFEDYIQSVDIAAFNKIWMYYLLDQLEMSPENHGNTMSIISVYFFYWIFFQNIINWIFFFNKTWSLYRNTVIAKTYHIKYCYV